MIPSKNRVNTCATTEFLQKLLCAKLILFFSQVMFGKCENITRKSKYWSWYQILFCVHSSVIWFFQIRSKKPKWKRERERERNLEIIIIEKKEKIKRLKITSQKIRLNIFSSCFLFRIFYLFIIFSLFSLWL